MKSKILLIGIVVLLLSVIGIISLINSDRKVELIENGMKNIYISELIPENTRLLPDKYGRYYDVIKIVNGTDNWVDLEGYGLSDNPMVTHKWSFPSIVLNSGESIVVYAAGDNNEFVHQSFSDDGLYASFKLDELGEKVLLSNNKGEILSIVAYEQVYPNMSITWIDGEYKYLIDGVIIENLHQFMAKQEIIPSHQSGVYKTGFDLTFDINKNYVLRYTLDGTDPTESDKEYKAGIYITDTAKLPTRISNLQNSYKYSAKVDDEYINKGLVVKARHYDGDIPIGDMFVGTYFVWDEGSKRYSIDIVSLTTDPNNLFNQDTGIYVVGSDFMLNAPLNTDSQTSANYHMRGKEWERPAYVEFFNEEGKLIYNQSIGIRIFGAASRGNVKKSFRLIAREEYGDKKFSIEIFEGLVDNEGEIIDSFDDLVLRSGGGDYRYTMFRDILTDRLVEGMLDYQAYKPVVLFVNGEYFGIYNIREYANEEFIAAHYNIDKDNVGIIAYIKEVELYAGNDKVLEDYNELMEFVENEDLSVDKNITYVESKVDLDNFIDYYSTQIYVGNWDWPGNNLKMWKYTGFLDESILDGRFRYILFDVDFGFGLYTNINNTSFDSFAFLHEDNETEWPNPNWSTSLYKNLMKNEVFRERFIIRFTDLLNSRFTKENVNHKVDELMAVYHDEMEEYILRYSYVDGIVKGIKDWKNHIEKHVKGFAIERDDYLLEYAKKQYGLEAVAIMMVEGSDYGDICINESFCLGETGVRNKLKYYVDYPIVLEAKEGDNAEFVRWEINGYNNIDVNIVEGDVYSTRIMLFPQDGVTIRAVFNE